MAIAAVHDDAVVDPALRLNTEMACIVRGGGGEHVAVSAGHRNRRMTEWSAGRKIRGTYQACSLDGHQGFQSMRLGESGCDRQADNEQDRKKTRLIHVFPPARVRPGNSGLTRSSRPITAALKMDSITATGIWVKTTSLAAVANA